MLEDKQNIDDIFSDALGDYQEEAPHYSWQNIQSDLKDIRKKRRIAFLRRIGMFLLILTTFWLGYWTSTYDLYHKSEAFYMRKTSNNSKPIESAHKSSFQDTVYFLGEEIIVKAKYYDREKVDIEKVADNTIKSDIIPQNKAVSSRNIQTKISTQHTDNKEFNQLLTNTLLCEDESHQDDGSFLSGNSAVMSNWSFGAKFSPVYSINQFGSTSGNTNDLYSQEDGIKRISSEILSAYTGGINVNYRISKRVSIESGLFYSNSKQLATVSGMPSALAHKPENNKLGNEDKPATVAPIPLQYSTLSYTQSLEYLELPFAIRYQVIDKKFGLDLAGGMSTNFLIKNNISRNIDSRLLNSDVNSTMYNAKFSLGLKYRFVEQIQFNLEPTVRYSINPASRTFFHKYPYSFAIFAGFIYNLK